MADQGHNNPDDRVHPTAEDMKLFRDGLNILDHIANLALLEHGAKEDKRKLAEINEAIKIEEERVKEADRYIKDQSDAIRRLSMLETAYKLTGEKDYRKGWAKTELTDPKSLLFAKAKGKEEDETKGGDIKGKGIKGEDAKGGDAKGGDAKGKDAKGENAKGDGGEDGDLDGGIASPLFVTESDEELDTN